MNRRSHFTVVIALLGIVLTPANIFSCLPFWYGPTFVRKDRPDSPAQPFNDGRLGILWPGFERQYLVIAYRYLTHKPLTTMEQESLASAPSASAAPWWKWSPGSSDQDGDPEIFAWLKARSAALGLEEVQKLDIQRYRYDSFNAYPNCGDDAFRNAAATAQSRAKTFGVGEQRTRDWVAAQDTVFQNCGSKDQSMSAPLRVPAPVTIDNPLLKFDRDYQIAAANFYGGDFDAAASDFGRIAQEPASPWHKVAPYLVARCYIRKSTLGATDENAFSPQEMRIAEDRLRAVIADKSLDTMHSAAQQLLNYVEARLHPDERMHALAVELVGGVSADDFHRDLFDYSWLLNRLVDRTDWVRHLARAEAWREGGESVAEAWRADATKSGLFDDLTDWVLTFPLDNSTSETYSFERWQSTKSLPWLLSALVAVHPNDRDFAKIEKAAASIAPDSPAYQTALYHRVRWLLEQNKQAAARELLDANLPRLAKSSLSDRNAFLAERFSVADNFPDFLKFAPRTPAELMDNIGNYSYFCEDGECTAFDRGPKIKVPERLEADSVRVLNYRLPLSLLAQAASSQLLPVEIRDKLALTTWLRAAILDDTTVARELEAHVSARYPELRSYFQQYDLAVSPDERRFAMVFMVMHYPEMKPFLYPGPLLESIETPGIRSGSWWCSDIGAAFAGGFSLIDVIVPNSYYGQRFDPATGEVGGVPEMPAFPTFLTAGERTQAQSQWDRLSAIGAAPDYFAPAVLNWAKAHPEDVRVPEALHLFVRSTRFGCVGNPTGPYSRQAFQLLHRRYPDSPWTKKTRYWWDKAY